MTVHGLILHTGQTIHVTDSMRRGRHLGIPGFYVRALHKLSGTQPLRQQQTYIITVLQ